MAATQEFEKEVAATHGLGGVRAITWDLIKKESAQSETSTALAKIINSRMPEESDQWPVELRQFHPYR